jgi:hypothetical protein
MLFKINLLLKMQYHWIFDISWKKRCTWYINPRRTDPNFSNKACGTK